MKPNWILVGPDGVSAGVVSLLTFHLPSRGIQAVLSQFQKGQLSVRQNIYPTRFGFYIQAVRGAASRVVFSFDSKRHDSATKSRLSKATRNRSKGYVKAVSLLDDREPSFTPPDPANIDFNRNAAGLFTWARNARNKGRISLTPIMTETPSLRLFSPPLYREGAGSKPPGTGQAVAGVLAFTLDMKDFSPTS